MAQNARNKAKIHLLGNDEVCAICRETFNENQGYSRCPICDTPFHLPCITQWFNGNNTCPSCRAPANFTGVYTVGNINEDLPLGPAPVGVAAPLGLAAQLAAFVPGPLGQMNMMDALEDYNRVLLVFMLIIGLLHFHRLLFLQRGQRGGSLYDCFVPTNKLKLVKDLEAEVMKQVKHTPDIKIESLLKLSLNELLQLLKDMGISDTTISKITNINMSTNNRKTRNSNRRVNKVPLRNRTLRNS
jgi:hypothetical protein